MWIHWESFSRKLYEILFYYRRFNILEDKQWSFSIAIFSIASKKKLSIGTSCQAKWFKSLEEHGQRSMKLYRDTISCNELSNADAPSSPVLERASFLLCSTYTNLLIVRTESLLQKNQSFWSMKKYLRNIPHPLNENQMVGE